MPIGNLTSQVLANIYLNEFDRFIVHHLKPHGYMRYGDDFILIAENYSQAQEMRSLAENFLADKLSLRLHNKNDVIVRTKSGIKYLGADIYPTGKRILKKTRQRIDQKLNYTNASSYSGLIKQIENEKNIKRFQWYLREVIDRDI